MSTRPQVMSYEEAREQIPDGPTNLAQIVGQLMVATESEGAHEAPVQRTPADDGEVRRLRPCLANAEAEIERRGQRIAHLHAALAQARKEHEDAVEVLRGIRSQHQYALARVQKQLDEAIAERAQLAARLAERDAPGPCPVCSAIKAMVLGETAPEPPAVVPLGALAVGQYAHLGARFKGYSAAIVAALDRADKWLTSAEISQVTGIPAKKVSTNIWHLCKPRGPVMRRGWPGRPGTRYRYRYALATKDFATQEEEAHADGD